jgi:hypothetical protein
MTIARLTMLTAALFIAAVAGTLILGARLVSADNGDTNVTIPDIICSRITCGENPDTLAPADRPVTSGDLGLTPERIAEIVAQSQIPAGASSARRRSKRSRTATTPPTR